MRLLSFSSLGDLHRHSCRHFHFLFLAFFCAKLPSLCLTVDIIFKFPTISRAFLCIFRAYLLSSLSRFIFPFYFSSLPFFLERAFSFLATQWNMRARVRHREKEPSLALRFSARVLRPCALFEAAPPARR